MPLLDVSEVLFDPDFATAFSRVRTTTYVGANGMPISSEQNKDFIGVINASRANELNRTPDGRRISGSIMVVARCDLRAGDESIGIDADMVIFNGKRYTVVSVSDYSHYGKGFVQAECELAALS